ncbi:MAG: hypothetical protein IKP64_06080 [Selenomonadaceae bacterium]|nr:hypothetical protein [Selenomonadaceae bacterium]MBR4383110.1 hypothetical protein [Selenomonadaceae bacterium]
MLKKFFIALTILFCVAGNIAEAANKFTDDQLKQMISSTRDNPATAPMNLDVATFKTNFNAFMSEFLKETNSGEDSAKLEKVFLIGDQNTITKNGKTLFVKNFLEDAAIFGSVNANGKFTVLNLFSTTAENKNEMLIRRLVFEAFVRGISPDVDATALLNKAKENPTVTANGVKFSFSTVDNMDIISVVAE